MASQPLPDPYEAVFGCGVIALAVASCLLPFGLSYPNFHNPRIEPRAAAWEYLSDHYQLAYAALLLTLTLLVIGLLTLQQYVLRHNVSSPGSVLTGTMLSLFGLALLLPQVGIQLALRDYAQTYVLVDQAELRSFNLASFGASSLFGGSGSMIFLIGATYLLAGIRDCHVFPRWTTVIFPIGFLLVVVGGGLVFKPLFFGYGTTSQFLRIIGGSLIAGTYLGCAWQMWQNKAMMRGVRSFPV
jgi:hypothetical protein